MSMLRCTLLPGEAGSERRRRTGRPPALVSTSSTPVVPCSSRSYFCSMPSLPITSVPR